ncbi:S8 family peptidase [Asticcacaulis sp. MM231]|uniref:S8 family peptidase n=1 Tax=Asticcacaulis sp. MM231 TaxID=3157666 RepID=UPI0032D5A4C7
MTVRAADTQAGRPEEATIFATPKGLSALRRKISEFETEDTPVTDEGKGGKPKNAALVQSIGIIVEASLRKLWRSPSAKFPSPTVTAPWEVWLEKDQAGEFIRKATAIGVVFDTERLDFPEDIVVLASATQALLASAVKHFGAVKALASPSNMIDFFDSMPVDEQDGWLAELQRRTTYGPLPTRNFVTIMDTGISLAHPLIAPVLNSADRHAARPAWGLNDVDGHGTELAGAALYGDVAAALQTMGPIQINHRLESVKIIPDRGSNPHHLLGAVTLAGVNAVELTPDRLRTFTMATTTSDDTPHDGAPTSWSSTLDQLSAGVAGDVKIQRLMLVSAGNTDQASFRTLSYPAACDHLDNELQSPAHAWNVVAVGAYTTKTVMPAQQQMATVAPAGDMSPSSRTASWTSEWPIKPDVVFEGGNWVHGHLPPPYPHPALATLTTSHEYPTRTFTTIADTSGATALGAKAITELWTDYPDLWPETIRALFVNSARWTPQMLSYLPVKPKKGDFDPLFTRYGFGVPDMDRARRSASNALSLIVQDRITPYKKHDKANSPHAHNEMKLFQLPWPAEALRALGATPVTLRVALSTFIVPNPSEAARGSKFGYASHNLRFKLNGPDERMTEFTKRISKAVGGDEKAASKFQDIWDFGPNRRDVGSLQIDQLTCQASDLARRNLLAVHPVTGWWKSKMVEHPEQNSVRFALVVEIDAGEVTTDLYTETAHKVSVRIAQQSLSRRVITTQGSLF